MPDSYPAHLSVRGFSKSFPAKAGLFARRGPPIRALDDVSFEIPRGSTLGVVGESGSGKSTLGRCLLRITKSDSGRVLWHEPGGPTTDVTTLRGEALRRFRPRMQVIFQDPYHALNPTRPIWEIVGEGLFIAGTATRAAIRERAAAILNTVGLNSSHLDRLRHEFSGGQRQRIAIARALIVEPEFLVCDEVTSALDTRTQAQVLELLREIQTRIHVTLLFISHDLPTVAAMSREVIVMHRGRIVERGAPESLFTHPNHAHTRELVAAVPHPDPRRRTFRPAPAA